MNQEKLSLHIIPVETLDGGVEFIIDPENKKCRVTPRFLSYAPEVQQYLLTKAAIEVIYQEGLERSDMATASIWASQGFKREHLVSALSILGKGEPTQESLLKVYDSLVKPCCDECAKKGGLA